MPRRGERERLACHAFDARREEPRRSAVAPRLAEQMRGRDTVGRRPRSVLRDGPWPCSPTSTASSRWFVRELGAHEVSVLEAAERARARRREPRAPRARRPTAASSWRGGCEPVVDRDAKQRRLEMLASTFDAVAVEEAPRRPRAPPAVQSASGRAPGRSASAPSAINALVIDANSPVLWGAARGRDIVPEAWAASPALPSRRRAASGGRRRASPRCPGMRCTRSAACVELPGIRKGKRVRHVEREGAAPFLVHSCAGIYLLTLVFAGGVRRAARGASGPRVAAAHRAAGARSAALSIPSPRDTGAGVIAMRRPRRR